MTEIPVALLVTLSVGTAAAVALALLLARSMREARRLRQRSAVAEKDLQDAMRHQAALATRAQAVEAEVRHLAAARIPDLAAALAHPNVPVRGVADPAFRGTELDRSLASVLDQVGDAVTKERLRVDGAAQSAMRGATTTIQALLYQLQTRLQTMQERYDDPFVAEDLLGADFLNEQAIRRIQATAIVCGAWPGLTRQNSHMGDVVVGAMSRLVGYARVQVTNQLRDPVGIVARAVEPVAVALTELMANALHYSHPELPVAVTIQQGNRGASIIVDDAGVGMHGEEMERAQRMITGEEVLLLTELGDPPRTGLATVGQLVKQYGFTTSIETSPYGGVRAIVHIPGETLLTLLDEEEQPMSPMAPVPRGSASTAAPAPPHGQPAARPEPAYGETVQLGAVQNPTADAAPPVRPAAGPAPSATGPAHAAPRVQDPGGPAHGSGPAVPDGGDALPRRRRRHPVPEASLDATAAVSPEPAPHGATSAAQAPQPTAHPEASPEESAERWAAFQRGTASGRAAVDEAAGPGPSHPHADPRSAEGNPQE